MVEIIGNLHTHTVYSDGFGTHDEVARAAIAAGIDFVVVTDHNIYVSGLDGYRTLGQQRVLLLVGEEVHDPNRQPQKNHLLIYEARRELAPLAHDLDALLQAVQQAGGIAYLAHIVDPPAPAFDQPDLSWEDWNLRGYTGLEIWNFMSEFKSKLRSLAHALYYAYRPQRVAQGPFAGALKRWDQLLKDGQRLFAIGGADAHAIPARLGPLRRTLFPYEFHFRSINTHVLVEEPLRGDLEYDRRLIFQALRRGRAFVANDLLASARGFHFTASGESSTLAYMGERVRSSFGVTLQIKLPHKADVRLIHNGVRVAQWPDCASTTYTARQPGAYRVEVSLPSGRSRRGWIYSNPIFVETAS